MGKTLITTQQAKGTTGGNRGFWVRRINVTENTKLPKRDPLGMQGFGWGS